MRHLAYLIAAVVPLTLTSCGTASHWINQAVGTAGNLLSPVTGILRVSEGGTERQWQESARRDYRRPAAATSSTAPAHDRR